MLYFCERFEGDESPLFLSNMKQIDILHKAVTEFLEGKQLFLVEIFVSSDNDIEVVIESEVGDVSLDDCVELSHYIEDQLDREVEDFSLTVGSAGLSSPFKVVKQYHKFVGSEIEITRIGGARLKADLISVTEDGITISYEALVKVEGQKKKVKEQREEFLSFNEIKTAKPVIKFK